MPFRAAIFDVDGVLIDSPHERAWRESLRDLMEHEWRELRDRTTWTPEAFTPLVYQRNVSGKPRESGARAALEHFGIPGDDVHVAGYSRRKQDVLERLIDAGDFAAYPDALRFLVRAKHVGLRIAAASSSKNASTLMAKVRVDASVLSAESLDLAPETTLLALLDADVSGRHFAHGKPYPEMFLAAAHELGVAPVDAVVLEDAVSGVLAAKAGGMAAIGIARADDVELLTGAGADLVVSSLDEVDTDSLVDGRLTTRRPSSAGP